MRHVVRTTAAFAASVALTVALALPAVATTTVSVTNAPAPKPAPAKEYPLDAAINSTVNGPIGEAAVAAKATAENPELQVAVKSVWRLAFDAFWNVLERMAKGFVGLFSPDTASVDVNAQTNAATAPPETRSQP